MNNETLLEDEARKLTCPFIRYCTNESGVIKDREPAIYVNANCTASECIAWRRLSFRSDRGYCGVAGKPSL